MPLHNNQSDPVTPALQLSERWKSGQQVDVAEFVKGFTELPTAILLSIVLVDQYEQWRIGNAIVAEEYFHRFPSIKMDRSAAVDLIYREYVLREHFHQAQPDEEFIQRFPEFAEDLSLQLQIHRLVENQPWADGSDTQPQMQLRPSDLTLVDDSMQIEWRHVASKNIKEHLPQMQGYQVN